jgi:predicted ATPase
MAQLKRLTIRGYKSIRALVDFDLGSLNVLIGANGAGKSNFISLFQMLAALAEGQLQVFVQAHGGPDGLLHGTRKRTPEMEAEFYFARNGYRFTLRATGERMIFTREETWFDGDYGQSTHTLGSGHDEAHIRDAENDTFARYVRPALASWRVYHFHHTSDSAPVRNAQPVRDNLLLKPDAGNLAPFLRRLREQQPEYYERIVQTVRLAAPFFGDFVYRSEVSERIDLEWFEAGDPNTPYGPRHLSDGTLRFISLATLLLQPTQFQPDTILIDEPELGLHPYALNLLAGLFKQAAEARQLIVSTQAAELISALEPQHVIVVDRLGGESTFKRLLPEELADWLKDYALGELWKMNVFGGRPTR